jgi:hypothetical protein
MHKNIAARQHHSLTDSAYISTTRTGVGCYQHNMGLANYCIQQFQQVSSQVYAIRPILVFYTSEKISKKWDNLLSYTTKAGTKKEEYRI